MSGGYCDAAERAIGFEYEKFEVCAWDFYGAGRSRLCEPDDAYRQQFGPHRFGV